MGDALFAQAFGTVDNRAMAGDGDKVGGYRVFEASDRLELVLGRAVDPVKARYALMAVLVVGAPLLGFWADAAGGVWVLVLGWVLPVVTLFASEARAAKGIATGIARKIVVSQQESRGYRETSGPVLDVDGHAFEAGQVEDVLIAHQHASHDDGTVERFQVWIVLPEFLVRLKQTPRLDEAKTLATLLRQRLGLVGEFDQSPRKAPSSRSKLYGLFLTFEIMYASCTPGISVLAPYGVWWAAGVLVAFDMLNYLILVGRGRKRFNAELPGFLTPRE